MKKSSFLLGGALLLATLFTTSCKEVMGSLDNPVSAYLEIDKTDLVLIPGEVNDKRVAETISTEAVVYESSDPKVVTVDRNTGKVTAVAPGEAIIKVSVPANDYYQAGNNQYAVKVIDMVLGEKNMLIGVGDHQTQIYKLLPDGAFGFPIKWTTNNKSIATVDENGKVDAVSEGAAVITATIGGKEFAFNVKAKEKTNLTALTAPYTAQDGEVLSGNTNYPVTIAAGATVGFSNVQIYLMTDFNGVSCEGNATIVIAEDTYNYSFQYYNYNKAVVKVGPAGTKLTLKGNGSFNAYGWNTNQAAGIGTDKLGTCGDIVIESGQIYAEGASNAAAIGAGDGGTCGNITITGGNVSAYGGWLASAIGCGATWNGPSTCGDITISDGHVQAMGSRCSAAIGSAFSYDNNDNICGNITITGGEVIAKCNNYYGSGIGCGLKNWSDQTGTPKCGSVTISGGEVVATKGSLATYDIGPSDWADNTGLFSGVIGDVNVTVVVKDENGNAAKIYTANPAAAPRRAAGTPSKIDIGDPSMAKHYPRPAVIRK